MSGRTEIEDCLEEHAWRERNQLDAMPQIGAAAVPDQKALNALKAQAVRDYPMEYDAPPKGHHLNDVLGFVALGLAALAVVIAVQWLKGTGYLPG